MPDTMLDRMHRPENPETSREAAASVIPSLSALRAKVLAFARMCGQGGFTDLGMNIHHNERGSTLRSRRAELVKDGLIVDSGRRYKPVEGGRSHVIWKIRDQG